MPSDPLFSPLPILEPPRRAYISPLTPVPSPPRPHMESPRLWLRPAQGRLVQLTWNLLQDLAGHAHAFPLPQALGETFVLLLKPSALAVGVVGLEPSALRPGWRELRFGLDPAFNDQGLVLEACQSLLACIGGGSPCRGVLATCAADSAADTKLFRALGMHRLKRNSERLQCWGLAWRVSLAS